MSEPDGFRLRPSLSEFRRSAGKRVGWVLLVAACLLLASALLGGVPIRVLVAIPALVVYLGIVALYYSMLSASISGEKLSYRNLWTGRMTWPSSAVRTVIVSKGSSTPGVDIGGRSAGRLLVLLDARGKRIARFSGPLWSPDDFERFASLLPAAEVHRFIDLSTTDAERLFPNALPFVLRHPYVFLTILVVAVVVPMTLLGSYLSS